MSGTALRFDQGKQKLELIPPFPMQKIGQVFTDGAKKYEPHNWKKGMKWSKVIGSLKRHLLKFESGEDFDEETGNYHLAHLATNAIFLLEYYKIYPQGDDRQHWYLKDLRIGLDIDGVLADFITHYERYYNEKFNIQSWDFDILIKQRLEQLKDNNHFWLSMPKLIEPKDIPFEPTCYITSRVCSKDITQEWLNKSGFPNVPIYNTSKYKTKVDIAKEEKIDIFVDDRFENFKDFNNSGICCYLFNQPHNIKYNVGYKRIRNLSELCHFSNDF